MRVAANHRHVICERGHWKIREHIVIDALMFISSCYFIYNALRDTAAEKLFDTVIQMTLEYILVQRFKKIEMGVRK